MSFFVFQNKETVEDHVKNPWTVVAATNIYDNPWINLTEFQVINPAGKEGIYGKVSFKNKAVGIVALDETQHTYLVGQYRFTMDTWSWEIPEGGSPLGVDTLESAQRELKEETGLTAKSWKLIQRSHLSNSVSDEEGLVFLAEGLTQGSSNHEDTEKGMKVMKLPFHEAHQMVIDGTITDSLSIIGILRVAGMLDNNKPN
ncbi:MAG: NUDIX hydrolase [Cyclobacteriaceae bacterium]|nr:NUDIX hydrolase [Cyclobacteriaceae bacterium]